MVCLSSFPPHAAALLRRGARAAGRLNTDWFVVYVETPRSRRTSSTPRHSATCWPTSRSRASRVRRWCAFEAKNPVPALLDFARSHGVAHIVIGRSQTGGWRRCWDVTTDLRLVREADDLDVHVVAFAGRRRRMTLRTRLLLAQVPLALALALVGVLAVVTRPTSAERRSHPHRQLPQRARRAADEGGASSASTAPRSSCSRRDATAALSQAADNRPRFEAELEVQEQNITEPGEAGGSRRAATHWTDYQRAFDAFVQLASRRAAPRPLRAGCCPRPSSRVKDAADSILAINQDAMVQAASSSAARATWHEPCTVFAVLALCWSGSSPPARW